MKKTALLLFGLLVFYSCLNSDNPRDFKYEYLPIDEVKTPANFTFGQIDTVKVKYTLPNSCYSFDRMYYETNDTIRTVAVTAFVALESPCTEMASQEEHSFTIRVSQKEDYVFKFYKGKDSNGENIFEEVIVPVN